MKFMQQKLPETWENTEGKYLCRLGLREDYSPLDDGALVWSTG